MTRITIRRSPRPIPSKFFEYKKIGDTITSRYIYIGKTIIHIGRW